MQKSKIVILKSLKKARISLKCIKFADFMFYLEY